MYLFVLNKEVSMRICKNCNTNMGDLAFYCKNCGIKLPKPSLGNLFEKYLDREDLDFLLCDTIDHNFKIVLAKMFGGKFCSDCGKEL